MLENVYTARVKLESIYEKIKTISSFGLNSDYLEKDLESIDKKFDSLRNFIPNSLSNTSSLAQDSKELEKTLRFVDELETLVNKIYSFFGIFETVQDINKIKEKRELSDSEFEALIKQINFNLLNLQKAQSFGKLKKNVLDNVYETIYPFIKYEFKKYGSSTILNHIYDMNIDISILNELAINDIDRMSNNKNLLQSLRDINYKKIDEENRNKIFLLASVYDDDYLEKIIQEMSEDLLSIDSKKRELLSCENKLKRQKDIRHTTSAYFGEATKDLLSGIIQGTFNITAIGLSLAFLVGANGVFINAISKENVPIIERHFDTKGYSEIDGEFFLEDTYEVKKGKIKITHFIPNEETRTWTINTYIVKDTNLDLKDYTNIELDPKRLVDTTELSFEEAGISNITEYKIATSSDGPINVPYTILNILILIVSFAFINVVAAVLIGLKFALLDDFGFDVSEPVEKITDAIELYRDKGGVNYNPVDDREAHRDYKEVKIDLENLIKKYNELFKEYPYLETMLNDRGMERKLKF